MVRVRFTVKFGFLREIQAHSPHWLKERLHVREVYLKLQLRATLFLN